MTQNEAHSALIRLLPQAKRAYAYTMQTTNSSLPRDHWLSCTVGCSGYRGGHGATWVVALDDFKAHNPNL